VTDEIVLKPELPIIDPHHHLWDRPGSRYLVDELLVDLGSGHDVRATVFVQCRSMYRTDGPEALKPVGEVAFIAAAAQEGKAKSGGRIDVCAGIIGHADLQRGDAVEEVLIAHEQAAKGRLRGIRHISAFDASNDFVAVSVGPGLLLDPRYRAGCACLARHGLLLEAWLFHHQLPELIDLARRLPELTIVLNHVGGPLGGGTYRARRGEVFAEWAGHIHALGRCANVVVKLGGFGMPMLGFGFDEEPQRASFQALATAWKPYIDVCLDAFGADRCMFESNFPVDRVSADYRTLWNAFKHYARDIAPGEKARLFSGTAGQVYRLALPERPVA
jgi:L-fuconolactonase